MAHQNPDMITKATEYTFMEPSSYYQINVRTKREKRAKVNNLYLKYRSIQQFEEESNNNSHHSWLFEPEDINKFISNLWNVRNHLEDKTKLKEREQEQEQEIARIRRINQLDSSLIRNLNLMNKGAVPEEMFPIMQEASKQISQLNFENCLLTYNEIDECWNYYLYFKKEARVRINVFDDVNSDEVDYFINVGGELIAASTMLLEELIRKIKGLTDGTK